MGDCGIVVRTRDVVVLWYSHEMCCCSVDKYCQLPQSSCDPTNHCAGVWIALECWTLVRIQADTNGWF